MRAVLPVLLLLLVLGGSARGEDPVPGIIFFADGTELRFQDVAKITGARIDLALGIIQQRIDRLYAAKEICLFYHNSKRWVRLADLDYLHVDTYDITEGHYIRGPILIRTKDGGNLKNDLELRYLVDVVVSDDSTGETRTIDGIPFADGGNLNIRRVVFE